MYIVFSGLFAFFLVFGLSIVIDKRVKAFGEIHDRKNKVKSLVIPFLQEYRLEDGRQDWRLKRRGQKVIFDDLAQFNPERLKKICDLLGKKFLAESLIETPLEISSEIDLHLNNQAIYLVYADDFEGVKNPDQAYRISIGNSGLVIKASTELGFFYALRTLESILLTNKKIPYGEILDYPDLEERRLHVDMGRKYISKEWFIQIIREMSFLKLNSLQLHFSENHGFRIESEYDPKIVSKQFLTKEDIKSIILEANKHFIKIIPSLDTPGHVDQILKVHPRYGQVDIDGKHYKSGLDITNPEAVQYIKGLYQEYMELFSTSSDFHIGGDEYMEFDRSPFTNKYKKVLDDYAKKKLGKDYGWKDAFAGYINDIGEFVYKKGFKPRVWNDGIYYGEDDRKDFPQKIKIHDYIGIDYWSKMPWNPSVSSLQTFIDRGHTDLYNVNSSFFYYVLRTTPPDDGRKQHSFDYLNQDRRIYENWTPGNFADNKIDDKSPLIKGAAMAIWTDHPGLVGEKTIMNDILSPLRSMAAKAWNIESDKIQSFEDFCKQWDIKDVK